jgi:hypothetical protein
MRSPVADPRPLRDSEPGHLPILGLRGYGIALVHPSGDVDKPIRQHRGTMESRGACDQCSSDKSPPNGAKPIGVRVVIRLPIGCGHDQTDHQFLQCVDCGSVWVTYTVSGVGGHGRIHQRLTKGLL